MALPATTSNPASSMPDIVSAVWESKRRKIRNYPVRVNRASEAGHPCERYLVLNRTRWQEKLLHGPDLEFIFEGGNMIEDMAIRELQEAGYLVIEQQRAFEWSALELTGHLDAKVVIDGTAYPVEIKGLNHQDWERINSVQDMLHSPKPWLRKYPAQLTMYLLATSSEVGFFYIKDKTTFQPKIIWVELDYEYAESICQKLERVNKHVHEGTLPDPVEDISLCSDCPFRHICLREVVGQELEMVDNTELEEKLRRRDELAPVVAEYHELERAIKWAVEGKEKLMVGSYLITGKWVERKGYEVPPSRYWQSRIVRVQ